MSCAVAFRGKYVTCCATIGSSFPISTSLKTNLCGGVSLVSYTLMADDCVCLQGYVDWHFFRVADPDTTSPGYNHPHSHYLHHSLSHFIRPPVPRGPHHRPTDWLP